MTARVIRLAEPGEHPRELADPDVAVHDRRACDRAAAALEAAARAESGGIDEAEAPRARGAVELLREEVAALRREVDALRAELRALVD